MAEIHQFHNEVDDCQSLSSFLSELDPLLGISGNNTTSRTAFENNIESSHRFRRHFSSYDKNGSSTTTTSTQTNSTKFPLSECESGTQSIRIRMPRGDDVKNYHAAASKKNRQKRKHEIETIKERNDLLENEQIILRRKVLDLTAQWKMLTDACINVSHGKCCCVVKNESRNERRKLLERENNILRLEVNKNRAVVGNVKTLLQQIAQTTLCTERLVLLNRRANNVVESLLSMNANAYADPAWHKCDAKNAFGALGSGLHTPSIAYQLFPLGCTFDTARSISLRIDVPGIPIQYVNMADILKRMLDPKFLTVYMQAIHNIQTGEIPNQILDYLQGTCKTVLQNEMEYIPNEPSFAEHETDKLGSNLRLVKICEQGLMHDHPESSSPSVQLLISHNATKIYSKYMNYGRSSSCCLKQDVDVEILSTAMLPENYEEIIIRGCGDMNDSARWDDLDYIMTQGLMISKSENSDRANFVMLSTMNLHQSLEKYEGYRRFHVNNKGRHSNNALKNEAEQGEGYFDIFLETTEKVIRTMDRLTKTGVWQ